MSDTGSEFQREGAAHRKERFAKSVRANGWMSSGVADERSVTRVCVLTRRAVNILAEVWGLIMQRFFSLIY